MLIRTWHHAYGICALLSALGSAACGGGGGDSEPTPVELAISVQFDGTAVHAVLTRALHEDEKVFLGVRRSAPGSIDCAPYVARNQPAVPGNLEGTALRGPAVDVSLSRGLYRDQAWVTGPTPELLATLADGVDVVIDLCLVRGGVVVAQSETDLFEAWDASTVGQPERRLHSPRAYAEACVAELGDIPFFPADATGGHATFDCADGTLVPMSVTDDVGKTTFPGTAQPACDRPQYLDGGCEPGARVAARKNDQGTRWVLLCRKGDPALPPGHFNDVALIGHNPLSGKTCFFQNALFAKTDATKIPHPADAARSRELWYGVHGGEGPDNLACASCHDADAWIHTPWIDGARDQNDLPIVPKLGVDPDYPLGANDSPYGLVNADAQGWTVPLQIVAEEASVCLHCHRLGTGQWLTWLPRLDGTEPAFLARTTSAFQSFERIHWMPPQLRGITAESWPDTPYAAAIAYLKQCALDPSACPTKPIPTTPPSTSGGNLYDEVVMVDSQLALRSLQLLGAPLPGSEGRCNECHAITRESLRGWETLTNAAFEVGGCLSPGASAAETVRCMRLNPDLEDSAYLAVYTGIFSTAAHLGWFHDTFRAAFPDDAALAVQELARFRAQAGMPRGNHPKFTQEELNIVATWFRRGLPALENTLPIEPPPDHCEVLVTSQLTEHIDSMASLGWAAKNVERNLRMFGCPEGAAPVDCLTMFPAAADAPFSLGWSVGDSTVRVLRELSFQTSFWTRSSADGRFIANGGGTFGATISDLGRGYDIPTNASYDPGFFPDNSGFVFQGGGTPFCTQDLLESEPSTITFNEPQCSQVGDVSLYQHLGTSLDGEDYFAVAGQFVGDSGGDGGDDDAFFDSTSTQFLTPMTFNGTHFVGQSAVPLLTPFEGDAVLSPSTRLLVTRQAGVDGSLNGFVIRGVAATQSGGTWDIEAPVIGTMCVRGGKPAVSFDERFMVVHHYAVLDEFAEYGYASASDPEWQAYVTAGTANLYLVDLRTGTSARITHMQAGQFALFPHFRSDGWIYFLVIDGGQRWMAASDAAIVAE